MAKVNNSNFAFNECITGVQHNVFSRTGLNKLLNNGHIQNIMTFNCSKIVDIATSNRARQLYKNISMLFLFPVKDGKLSTCLLYTSPSPRDRQKSRMPSSA